MKEKIINELKKLINSKLVDIKRGKNILYLTFEKGGKAYNLKVECPFRFLKDEKIIIASYSIYTYNLKNEEINDLEYDKQNQIFDKKIEEMLNETEIFVQDIGGNDFEKIKIFFNNQLIFEVFNDVSDKEIIHNSLLKESIYFTT
ncbi:MAG: hypothetical protein ACI4UU_05085 [Clostridia bacterium]